MAKNKSLNTAAKAKEDEFYTQLSDIEKEMRYYRNHFKGKTILCNCDDPYESNFFKYFVLNFNKLEIKKIIATSFSGSPIANTKLSTKEIIGENVNTPYKAIVTEVYDTTGDGGVDMLDVAALFKSKKNKLIKLKGDGDFRSSECLELLEESDIVVTNPPFSLFRQFLAVLLEYKKSFVIIGSQNNVTYKDVFPLIKNNEVWLGYKAGDMAFRVPEHYEPRETRYWQDEEGQKWRSLGNICWFTNLDIRKRHEKMILVQKYNENLYQQYDDYEAIEISRVVDIPYDYTGVMGVPITFLDKYNPEQFEIIGLDRYTVPKEFLVGGRLAIDGSPKYARILIRNKSPETIKEVKK